MGEASTDRATENDIVRRWLTEIPQAGDFQDGAAAAGYAACPTNRYCRLPHGEDGISAKTYPEQTRTSWRDYVGGLDWTKLRESIGISPKAKREQGYQESRMVRKIKEMLGIYPRKPR
ncbi:MAG: hypothetical protein HYU56_05610 [Candidatus Aenigmarchaeota archaeon]|nr:hypothetical protein [Candidatus Aenigmarchaeota archaeon]